MINDLSLRLLATMQSLLYSVRNDERGQDTLEWVLMSGLIAAGIVALLAAFTGVLGTMITNVGYCLDFTDATSCAPGF